MIKDYCDGMMWTGWMEGSYSFQNPEVISPVIPLSHEEASIECARALSSSRKQWRDMGGSSRKTGTALTAT